MSTFINVLITAVVVGTPFAIAGYKASKALNKVEPPKPKKDVKFLHDPLVDATLYETDETVIMDSNFL